MNHKIVVFGNGFLGKRVAEVLNAPLVISYVINTGSIMEALRQYDEVDTIINACGKTGRPNIDSLENEKPSTYFSNVHVPYLLAEYCKPRNIKLVHVSSGCIYMGDNEGRGWSETDKPNFEGSFYSFTKSAAERVLSAYPDTLILRMRMPISDTPGGRELLGKLLRYNNIINTPNSVTIVDDFISTMQFLLRNKATGIFNVCNPEPVTHKQILDIYEEISGKKLEKIYIDKDALVTVAPRSNCVLNIDKLIGYLPYDESWKGMRKTEVALRDVISKYIQNGG